MRSAIRPAVAAPIAQPISAMAMTWASAAEPTRRWRSRMASTAPLMTGAVVAEEEAAHGGRGRDEGDVAEVVGLGVPGRPAPSAQCWSTCAPRATGLARPGVRRALRLRSSGAQARAAHHPEGKSNAQRLCLQLSEVNRWCRDFSAWK